MLEPVVWITSCYDHTLHTTFSRNRYCHDDTVTTMQIIIEINKLCKREHGESNALDSWKLNIFKIIDDRI